PGSPPRPRALPPPRSDPRPPPPAAAALLPPVRPPRRRRPQTRAAHLHPPLQLSPPQLQPPPQVPLRLQLRAHRLERRPQRGKLRILRLADRPQPREQPTLLPSRTRQIGLIGHKPRACSA